ncbi:hypothetical protein HHL19_09330 [Streptomyces sp. R302]|uniref:hypothetical protein n=1 Tax=unclassified Streptomyces TaxID=2593676 RepID=UPI00145DA38F|nr:MULTISPECIES: hypothetical protein [unclassified Streptomyces]NML53031.1 hypothetical protein [Streptomyces sp. R301]NML78866.1 hypothetical protein [Streptomyces sp. R302]
MGKGAAGVVAVGLLLAGCGGGGGDGDGGQKPEGRERTATASAAPREERRPRVAVPAAFDGAKGWAVESSEGLSSPVYAPHAKEVLFLKNARDGKSTQVVARDLRTGDVRWTGAPVALPVSGRRGTVDGEVSLLVTAKGETDYAVVRFTGEKGGDGASKPRATTRLTVFPAGGSGSVEASRTFEFPYKRETFAAQDSEGVVHNFTRLGSRNAQPLAVDVVTGEQTTYTRRQLAAPSGVRRCTERRIIGQSDCDERAGIFGVSPRGPLASAFGSSFWLGGGSWHSGTSEPPDIEHTAASSLVQPYYLGGVIIADWSAGRNGAVRRYEVRDPGTGKVRVAVRCEGKRIDLDVGPPVPTLSGGRYVHAGPVVLDLRENKGYCFEDTEDRKRVTFTSVDAGRGIAYGTVPADRSGRPALPVEVDLAADKVTPLGPDVEPPAWIAEGVAAYVPKYGKRTWTSGFTAGFYPSK